MKPFLLILCILMPGLLAAQTLLNRGATMTLTPGSSLVIEGDLLTEQTATFVNDGAIILSGDIDHQSTQAFSSGAGVVEINGGSLQTFRGAQPIDLHQLDLNHSGAGLRLDTTLRLSGDLMMLQGDLELHNGDLELSDASLLMGERNDARIYGVGGVIRTERILNAPSALDIAGMGLTLTSSQNLGLTTLVRGHAPQTNPQGASSIERYYALTPTNNAGLNATLRFAYFDAEIGSQDESQFLLWRSDDGGATWSDAGGTPNPGANYLEQTGLASLSRFSLIDIVAVSFPVEWLSFTAEPQEGRYVALRWETASELGSDYFVLERAGDNSDFQPLAQLAAAGYSQVPLGYAYDDQAPLPGRAYYRLRQVDLDGSYSYSEVREVWFDGKAQPQLAPNPWRVDGPQPALIGLTPGAHHFMIFDLSGRELLAQRFHISPGEAQLRLDLPELPEGVYTWSLMDPQGTVHGGKLKVLR